MKTTCILLLAGSVMLAAASVFAAPNTPENWAWNVNMNPDGSNPANYYGNWPGHTYFPSADDWRKVPVYQFITDRFADGNPENSDIAPGGYDLGSVGARHGGDFKGVTDRLPYIHALGYKAIWISPIFQNRENSYHGYGETDFTLLDNRFGTVEELREMVNKAHALGLYVIVDIVVNHLSDSYYFEGHQYDGAPFRLHANEYRLFQRVTGQGYTDLWVDNNYYAGGTYCDVYDSYGWKIVDNYGTSGSFWSSDLHHNGDLGDYGDPWQNHLGKIYGALDDVRTTHPRVQDKIIAMTKSLVSSCDIDGIRMDTPMQVPYYFFSRWCPAVKAHAAALGKDNFWIWGEFFCERGRAATMVGRGREPWMWGQPYTFIGSAYTMDGGINYRAYFGFFQPALKDQANGNLGKLKENYDTDWQAFDFYDPERGQTRYGQLNFYNNHDQWRMVHNPAGADAGFKKTDLGSAIIAFWPGVPLFYYGDEQGFCSYGTALDGWAREDFMTSLAWKNVNALVTPNPANVDNFDQCNAHYQYVQKCMNVRGQYPALQNTDEIYERWRQVNDGNGIYAYTRAWGAPSEWALVAFNTWGDWLKSGGSLGDFWTGWNQGDVIVNAFNPSETYTLGQYGKINELWLAPYECKVFVKQSRWTPLNPVVTWSWPKHDERVAGGNYGVKIYFSEAMDEASVKAAFRYDGQAVDPGQLGWNAGTKELSLTVNVADGLHYINVLPTAMSLAGKPLFGEFRARFRSGPDQNIICNPNATWDDSLLNNGAGSTGSQMVNLNHKATGAAKFRVKNETGGWSAWQAYSAVTTWNLTAGVGGKTVTVQYWADDSAAYYVSDNIQLSADNRSLIVNSDHGEVQPPVGTHYYSVGYPLGCNVMASPVTVGSTQYLCTGWSGSGSVPASGSSTSVFFALNDNSAITWQWQTKYYLDTDAKPHGTVGAGEGWHNAGDGVALNANAELWYRFLRWEGNVPSGSKESNPLNLTMDQPRNVVAYFTAQTATNETPLWWLAAHGWTADFDAAALGDQDGDGMPTWQEHAAGTDPTNRASVLELDGLQAAGGRLLSWPSVGQRVYGLLRGANLASGLQVLTNGLAAEAPTNTYWDAESPADAALYYRVKARRLAAVEWIGNTYHFPSNGSINSWDPFWVNIESWPRGAAVRVVVRYSTDGATWLDADLEYGGLQGGNDWWHLNLGTFPSGAHIRYAIKVVDGLGGETWDNNGGADYHAYVN